MVGSSGERRSEAQEGNDGWVEGRKMLEEGSKGEEEKVLKVRGCCKGSCHWGRTVGPRGRGGIH
jgi:hypothetical protein